MSNALVKYNASGIQTASRTYYAYGATRSSSSGTLQTDRTFTGQKADGTGLLYYNARYLRPDAGYIPFAGYAGAGYGAGD